MKNDVKSCINCKHLIMNPNPKSEYELGDCKKLMEIDQAEAPNWFLEIGFIYFEHPCKHFEPDLPDYIKVWKEKLGEEV